MIVDRDNQRVIGVQAHLIKNDTCKTRCIPWVGDLEFAMLAWSVATADADGDGIADDKARAPATVWTAMLTHFLQVIAKIIADVWDIFV